MNSLAQEMSISLVSNYLSQKLDIEPEDINFAVKASFVLISSGFNNLDSNFINSLLDKNNTDEKFNKLIDESNLDKNVKDALKSIYKETRTTDFDNLNIFRLKQVSEEIKKEFNLTDYITSTITDASEKLKEDAIIGAISSHKTYISEDDEKDKNNDYGSDLF